MLLGMGAAAWPVWRWYFLRITDGSDEPWGLLPLLCIGAFWVRDSAGSRIEEKHFIIPALIFGVYIATFHSLVPLLRAVLVITAFGLLLFRGGRAGGLWGLLGLHLLALPIMATLQFYAGYPLRLLAAWGSAGILQVCGYGVGREGTLLSWAGETVMMDAPCSGVQMLWAGMFLALLLAAFHRLDGGRTLAITAGAAVIVTGGNVVRATALFFKEAHIVSLPDWTHAGIGLLLFAGCAWLILGLTERLALREDRLLMNAAKVEQ